MRAAYGVGQAGAYPTNANIIISVITIRCLASSAEGLRTALL